MKLVAKNLSVDRGSRRIVENVSFSLKPGEALTVTGENGAGKSTLLRAIAGLLSIKSGTLELDGLNSDSSLPEECHYLGHKNAMKDALSVRENLEFWQGFASDPDQDVSDAIEKVELSHAFDLPFGYLSTGMKRRAALARLLINKRAIWILDEPTSGLDAKSGLVFSKLCKNFCANGGMIIAATHLPLGLKKSKSLELSRLTNSFVGELF